MEKITATLHVKMDLFLASWAPSSPTLDGQTAELVIVCCEKLCLFLSFGEGLLSNVLSPPIRGFVLWDVQLCSRAIGFVCLPRH